MAVPWTVVAGGLAANGCNGAGATFFCLNSAGAGAGHSGAGDTDTWVIRLDLAAPLDATQTVHFKGHFVDANGNKIGELISDDFYGEPLRVNRTAARARVSRQPQFPSLPRCS